MRDPILEALIPLHPQPPCGSRRPRHVRRTSLGVLAVSIAVVAGCSANPATHSAGHQRAVSQQTVTGKFVRAGGPAPGSPVPLPGTITARAASGQTFTARVGGNGRFKLSLPPASYYVTGRSPLMQSGQMICGAAARLRVTRDKPPSPVTVVCSIP